jgi:transcriptional regulator with XRE-family HTH domain
MANELNERLKALRAEAGMTQGQLATASDLARSTIARFETTQVEITPGATAAIAKGIGVDQHVLSDYLAGKITSAEVLAQSKRTPRALSMGPERDHQAYVRAGQLANIAADVFRSSNDLTLAAFDTVRRWLREIEQGGLGSMLDERDAAQRVIREMFAVASDTKEPTEKMPLVKVFLATSVRLSYLTFALVDGTDPADFIEERRQAVRKEKLDFSREKHRDLYKQAQQWIAENSTSRAIEVFDYYASALNDFVSGEYHDEEHTWVEIARRFEDMGIGDIPF